MYVVSGAHKGRSVQLRGMAFESEQLEHLPYMDLSSSGDKCCYHSQCVKAGIYTLCSAMITTLMPHLSIGPYKEGVLIVQIQMPFYPIVLGWTLLPL